MEDHGLASQILVVILGEGDVNVLLLACGHAYDLLLKTGNKLAGAQFQVEALALAALKGDTAFKALEVDVGGISHLGSTLHHLGGRNVLRHPVKLCLNLSIGNRSLGLLHFQALILTQRNLGVNLGGQSQGDDMVIADLHIRQAGTAHGLQFLLHNGKIVNLRENLLQAVFIKDMGTIHGLDHLPGRLALPEAGELDVLAGLHVSLVDTGLHQFLVDLHNDGGFIAVSFCALNDHFYILLNWFAD